MKRLIALTLVCFGSTVCIAATAPQLGTKATPNSEPPSPNSHLPSPISEPAPDALTLDQALAIAEQSHPDLAAAHSLVRAADGRVQQAGVRPNPDAIGRIENAPWNDRVARNADYLAGIGLTLPLGDRRSRAVRVEELDRQRLAAEADSRRLDLRRRVHGAFALALYQDQARQLRNELTAAAAGAVRLTRIRVDTGDAVPADLARVETELAVAEGESRRSDLLRQQAFGALATAIGQPPGFVRAIEGTLAATFEVPALEELASQLGDHPSITAASADLSARTAAVDWSRALRIPDLRAELLYRRIESQQQDAFDVGFSLPLPLFDRGRGRLREAQGQQDAAEARLRSARLQLQGTLREAHALLTASLNEARTLETGILPRMRSVRQSAEARYAAGDLSLGDVLPVRRDDALVRLRHLEALRDTMLAWAQLRPLVGR